MSKLKAFASDKFKIAEMVDFVLDKVEDIMFYFLTYFLTFPRLLLKRHFKAWRGLPEEIQKEKEREKRRRELREKVASLLPDFEPTTSVNESTDFS